MNEPFPATPAATPLHPRPQLTRERWDDLSGVWGFAHDDEDRRLDGRWFEREDVFDQQITVPFPPESRASGLRATGYHPVVWYRRTVRVAPEGRTGHVLLHFGAVDYRARVWVNGRLVAQHEGGHTPFTADITPALVPGETQVVVVRAEDDPADLAQPRGKQDWEETPHAIWYHRTTGIWQPVWLEYVPRTFIQTLRWTPDVERGRLGLVLRLNRDAGQGLRVRVRLSIRGQRLADDTYALEGQEVRREIELDPGRFRAERQDLLWSPRRPNLIDARISLLDEDDNVMDEVGSYAGLRSVGVRDGRFQLNGSAYYLRLVLAQNYWPESHLAAPSEEALRREVELIKALGFNGVRIHQKVEDPRFLYWCDRLGVLVWGEMANSFVFTPEAQRRLTREWLEVLERDASHPCIVTWVPINESWGVPNLEGDPAQRAFVRGLYHLTKSLDPTRPVIGNDGWELVEGDILGVHDYALDGATLRERYGSEEALEHTLRAVQPSSRNFYLAGHHRQGEPVMLTEFGGLSHAPSESERWWGYGTLPDSDTLLSRYEELLTAVLDSPVIAGFCYTQLTDTEQETNGLLREDRTPKLDPERVRAVTSRVSRAVQHDVLVEIHALADERRRAQMLAQTQGEVMAED
ncbi:glycoside hydrolase family 2 (plasmid) [Deinococcus metallilatus]|uniref:Beta-galactosidase/beta-glucuronidase n=1 Tax=Deinococcus metallilatus TaxID=1211322 RepID=A0ABR6N000_9DEIO|nr:sugar-binding domain-containing protein [Deinococcus metallilatus]MBB5296950.1 beta-galactosidase/beta-glucuronidase [Deinococcus metallilatus]QBY06682.1 glycoside hydrolase family 2 [Deinococcus metallilatus]GMA15151.1 beta-galactosidase [Deinococcus metallilatus]